MATSDAWIAILAAGAVTQALRYVPVLLLRWRGDKIPAVVSRMLECAGLATIGSLIACAVFRNNSTLTSSLDATIKFVALSIAFIFYLKVRKSMLSLAVGYAAYVLLVLTFLP
jgi:branched-subunit amino acid transport protein